MNILAIGDVMGKPGRRALAELLPALRDELKLDLVIANGIPHPRPLSQGERGDRQALLAPSRIGVRAAASAEVGDS